MSSATAEMDHEFYECVRTMREWLKFPNLEPCFTMYLERAISRLKHEEENSKLVLQNFFAFGLILIVFLSLLLIIWLITIAILKVIAKRRSKRASVVTRAPTIPFPQKGLYEYQGDNHKRHVIPEVRILCSPTSKKYCTSSIFNELMIDLFKIKENKQDDETSIKLGKKCPIPKNCRVISIKMDGFKHGDNLHDFEPIGGSAPESYYTFQMLGRNRIQMTSYVEGGVSYPAGFCIYFKNIGIREQEFPIDVIRKAWNGEKYPGRMETAHLSKLNWKSLSQIASAPIEEENEEVEEEEDGEEGIALSVVTVRSFSKELIMEKTNWQPPSYSPITIDRD